MKCNLCPRRCGVDRKNGQVGVCRAPDALLVSKIMLHKWEEPCISGERGAGTVFFAGCNLHCVYCQNRDISNGGRGSIMTEDMLEEAILDLADRGAECIEFVTPTHYTDKIVSVLKNIKPRLSIPTVWNSGGYESVESLRMLDGLVDVYMPDFKYFDAEIANRYSSSPDYLTVATDAVEEMLRQVGQPRFDERGMMKSGVLIRHLVLPSHRNDSIAILKHIAGKFSPNSLIISLMSQYTPDFYADSGCDRYKNLRRRLTTFEYDSVMRIADELGFEGYFQGSGSADKQYTPEF